MTFVVVDVVVVAAVIVVAVRPADRRLRARREFFQPSSMK